MSTTGSQTTGPGIVPGPDQQVENAPGLLTLGSYLRRGQASADARRLFLTGGREADTFYRHRWSHDKMVHSTHGVNCTGSCAWEVYVSDGIITWEKQITDYPTTGPDMPEYEPRGCPRGAAFSWYTYSPTRVRYPYVRGVLLEMYREAREAHGGDAVAAWASIVDDPAKRLNAPMKLIDAHIDAIRAVVRDQIKTDEHPTGRALAETLEARVADHLAG